MVGMVIVSMTVAQLSCTLCCRGPRVPGIVGCFECFALVSLSCLDCCPLVVHHVGLTATQFSGDQVDTTFLVTKVGFDQFMPWQQL